MELIWNETRESFTTLYLTLEEFQESTNSHNFDLDTLTACTQKTSTLLNPPMIYPDYTFLLVHIMDLDHMLCLQDKMALYLKKDALLIISLQDEDQRIFHGYHSTVKAAQNIEKITLEEFIYLFLNQFVAKDLQGLERFTITLEDLETKILEEQMTEIKQELFLYRRKLLLLRNYYGQFSALLEDLISNTNEILGKEPLSFLPLLYQRIRRLSSQVDSLSEFATQIRESYQAQIDISLNQIMKVFTIITAIFMPLTLIAGWYGMNFRYMPELTSRYGYPFVIVLSLLTLILSIIWFKRKHFF